MVCRYTSKGVKHHLRHHALCICGLLSVGSKFIIQPCLLLLLLL